VNILTRLQAVEYITSQNLDRRAFERFTAILVVPGAIGAWRKSVVEGVGGYSSETLAEDADLTVAIICAGYRVTYEAGAIAMTEAPETLSQLLRQRLRWSLGIMQTGWKHKRAIREGNGIGLVAIPNILLFGVILSLFAPIADIVFISALFRLGRDLIHHPTMIPGLSSPAIFIAYACVSIIGCVFVGTSFGSGTKRGQTLVALGAVPAVLLSPTIVYRDAEICRAGFDRPPDRLAKTYANGRCQRDRTQSAIRTSGCGIAAR
jgi:cellulose synthase/poly-beta-1,6-N-acetylglucosamine synthase-like glycosyltransferase